MVVLYVAFRYIDCHAGDYERITIRGDSVAVEVRDGIRVACFELNRYWAQVVCEHDGARRPGKVELGIEIEGPARMLLSFVKVALAIGARGLVQFILRSYSIDQPAARTGYNKNRQRDGDSSLREFH